MTDLREIEAKVLLTLQRLGGKARTKQVAADSGLDPAASMRASLTLAELGLIETSVRRRILLRLNEEGISYAELKLPERRMVEAALQSSRPRDVWELLRIARVPEAMAPVALGWIKRKNWGKIAKMEGRMQLQVDKVPAQAKDEQLLDLLHQRRGAYLDELPETLQSAVATLKRRKLLEASETIERTHALTEKGLGILRQGIQPTRETTALTSDMIVSGGWRSVKLREYDVTASPPEIHPGKKHVFAQFIDRAREVLNSMGFEEAEGPYVETEFWNFDVLFQAQDHPAREIHDSYVVSRPEKGRLEFPDIARNVAQTHEDGWETGSTGWGYRWSLEKAQHLVLRTQTTAVSMRYLATHREPPVKMYCLSKIFRPDVMDALHIQEPHQLDGIVGDRGITLRHLLGFLQAFASALDLGEVKFRPHYFPFTEPSVESYIKHPKLGWIEFVGSGVFRPEVLKPLGIDFPVIAWGIGFDRLAMIALGIDDIRDLYSRRLDWLRQKPLR